MIDFTNSESLIPKNGYCGRADTPFTHLANENDVKAALEESSVKIKEFLKSRLFTSAT